MSKWSKQFKSKEEKQIEEIDAELYKLAITIKANNAEMMAGAPKRDYQGVRVLKNETIAAQNRVGVLERKKARITDQMTGQNK